MRYLGFFERTIKGSLVRALLYEKPDGSIKVISTHTGGEHSFSNWDEAKAQIPKDARLTLIREPSQQGQLQ